MKLLKAFGTLVSKRSDREVGKARTIPREHKSVNSNIIDGKCKVIPTYDEDIQWLDAVNRHATAQAKRDAKVEHDDKVAYNISRTGYANPYTAPIQRNLI